MVAIAALRSFQDTRSADRRGGLREHGRDRVGAVIASGRPLRPPVRTPGATAAALLRTGAAPVAHLHPRGIEEHPGRNRPKRRSSS